MDFLKLIRSVEELLFELAAWCLFYPRTLWRVLTTPAAMVRYSDAQQKPGQPEGTEPYAREMSPPALLLLSLLLVHLIEMAVHVKLPVPHNELARPMLTPGLNLLVVRATLYSVLPLLIAASILRDQKTEIERSKLRPLYYGQCYLVAPFSIAVSGGSLLSRLWAPLPWAGLALLLSGMGWFLWAEAVHLRERLGVTHGRAYLTAAWWIARSIGAVVVIIMGIGVLL